MEEAKLQENNDNGSVPSKSLIDELSKTTHQNIQSLQALKMNQSGDTNIDPLSYMPGPLQPSGIALQDVSFRLEKLITESEDETFAERTRGSSLRQLDDVSKAAVVSHSFAAYVSTLESRQLRKLATRISSDTGLWICRLLRFFDSSSYFHEESRDGLLRICRMCLHIKFPRFTAEGYEALYARPPVIYLSAAAKPNLGQYLCTQLGLPLSCLSIVPCNTVFGSSYKMDIASLERLLQEDLAAARTPLLLVAYAGSPITGQVDALPRLQEICKAHDLWLHVEGLSLSALSLVSVPNLPARIGDSMTLSLGTWLGVPAVPFITLFRIVDSSCVHVSGLSSLNLQVRLSCLPLWTVLQTLGHDGVVQRIKHCFQLSERLIMKLEETPKIAIVGQERVKSKDGQTCSVCDVMSKAVSTTLLFDILVPIVLFQYVASENVMKSTHSPADNTEEAEFQRKLTRNPPYFDNLNSWLGQILMRDVPTVRLDIVELEHHGFTICFSPLESAHAMNTTLEDIDDLCNCLQQQLSILNATVKQKELFQQMIAVHKNLQVVNITSWAGLGAVRYIPALLVGRLNELTDSGKEEINRLNSELVSKLKSTDSAFSLGEGDDGMLGVRFGMVTDDLDMDELIGLVLSHGQEVEESSKFLESMAEMVRIGIEEAKKELEKENMEKLMQEGILRHVPIVGGLVNWWSPPTKDSGVKGRSFNLSSGTVESTENIYKYHMQVMDATSPASNKSKLESLSPLVDQCNTNVLIPEGN